MCSREETLEALREIAHQDRLEQGAEIAGTVERITDLYPSDWTPHPKGIAWQGYVIGYSFGGPGGHAMLTLYGFIDIEQPRLFRKPLHKQAQTWSMFHDADSLLEAMQAINPGDTDNIT